jgi:hypothetical protein
VIGALRNRDFYDGIALPALGILRVTRLAFCGQEDGKSGWFGSLGSI